MTTETIDAGVFRNDDHFSQDGRYVGRWSDARFVRWANGVENEPDLTSALLAAQKDLQSFLVRYLRTEAGLEFEPASYKYEIVGAGSASLGFPARQAPDLFIMRRELEPENDDWVLDLAIEVKRGANLNGGWRREGGQVVDYCTVHGRAGSQLVCYPAECWIGGYDPERAYHRFTYLFAAPGAVLRDFPHHVPMSWHAAKSNTGFLWNDEAKKALELELEWSAKWRITSLESLADAVEAEFPHQLTPLVAALRKRH